MFANEFVLLRRVLALVVLVAFGAPSTSRAQSTGQVEAETEPDSRLAAPLPEPPAPDDAPPEIELAPAAVARDDEGVMVSIPDVDLELVNGNARARELDARRRRLAWAGTFQGGLLLVLMPRAVRTIRDSGDPAVRAVTGSWIALGSTIINVTAVIGAHATLQESRLYRCGNRETSRRAGRTAMALGAIPGLALISPLFAHRQHELNERTRMCELRETLRARRVRIIATDDDEAP